MIGRLLCFIGRHEWWARSTWPFGSGRTDVNDHYLDAVCGRCPARKYR